METACSLAENIPRGHRHDAGFTLLELMVAVVMVGVLAGLAIATMQADNYRVKNAAQNLVADLNGVRASAIRANQNISVVFGSGGYNATGSNLQVSLPDSIELDSSFGSNLTFNSMGAAPNALFGHADVELANDNATRCRVRVNNAGRIWIDNCQL
jgi:prepilin-type N-terminal cleavage/methylation domain-containing protein